MFKNITYTKNIAIALLLVTISQILLFGGHHQVYSYRPIDWGHWVGIVSIYYLLFSVMSEQFSGIQKIGRILLLIGSLGLMATFTIDLLTWVVSSNQSALSIINQASTNSTIYFPFYLVSPLLLYAGLLLILIPALKNNKINLTIFVISVILSIIGLTLRIKLLPIIFLFVVVFCLFFVATPLNKKHK